MRRFKMKYALRKSSSAFEMDINSQLEPQRPVSKPHQKKKTVARFRRVYFRKKIRNVLVRVLVMKSMLVKKRLKREKW